MMQTGDGLTRCQRTRAAWPDVDWQLWSSMLRTADIALPAGRTTVVHATWISAALACLPMLRAGTIEVSDQGRAAVPAVPACAAAAAVPALLGSWAPAPRALCPGVHGT